MLDQATMKIRSVVVECRQWADSYGQPHSSGALWVNGRFIASFPLRYGAASVLEEYEIAPYLESLGIVSQFDQHRGINNRVRASGADYYLFATWHKKRDCFRSEHRVTPLELAEELAREENIRVVLEKN